jgi:pyruvate, water dikinase
VHPQHAARSRGDQSFLCRCRSASRTVPPLTPSRPAQLYILQARPETVQSRTPAGSLQRYRIADRGPVLIEGRAIVQKIGAGAVRVLQSVDSMHEFVPGEVLVADMTDPDWEPMPEIPVKIMMNVGTPEQAFAFSRLPNAGVGLARLEFIIHRQIGIHPKALLELDTLEEPPQAQIAEQIAAHASPRDYFVTRVAEGAAMLAAAFAPHPVIVRMSDFKSNEYANPVGGELYEPHEENSMIGYRASRCLSPDFADCFTMECNAPSYVRDQMGLTNVKDHDPVRRHP